MCGVIGVSGFFTAAALQAGVAAISHRGPDDAGMYTDPVAQIGLGHTRLSI
jgi:asparagine synthase (glutamine-hydrolysing)